MLTRHVLAVATLAFLLCGSAVEAQSLRAAAQNACRTASGLAVAAIHQEWARGAPPLKETPADANATGVYLAFFALLSKLRNDPTLSRMTKDEFTALATRVCEPVYEVYFEQLEKKARRGE